MDPHSLPLLGASVVLDGRSTPQLIGPARRIQQLRQSLARLFPQLRQQISKWNQRRDPATVRCSDAAAVGNASQASTSGCPTSYAAHGLPSTYHPRAGRQRALEEAPRGRAVWRHVLRRRQPQARSPPQLISHDIFTQPQQPPARQPTLHASPRPAHTPGHGHHRALGRKAGPLRRLGRALRLVATHMRPQGPGENDKSTPERVANVATCGMFLHAGAKIVRQCRSLAARRFGWAFMAVGVIATLYHGCWGRIRPLARKVDYYSIALSSMLLRSAVLGPVPRWLTAAMLLAIPFKPTLVTSSNFTAVEVRYLLLALAQRNLLGAWAVHTGLVVAATVSFTLDETPLLSWFPYTHAGFHLLSAGTFMTFPSALNLIAHV